MKRKKFTEEQIAGVLRQAEAGVSVKDLCRSHGFTEQTYYRWKRQYEGMGVSELRELKQTREENKKLRRLVADLTLDKHILQEALKKKF